MARRRRKSGFDLIMDALAKLRWQVCLLAIVPAYFGFAVLSQLPLPETKAMEGLGLLVMMQFVRTISGILQFIAPLMFGFAAVGSWFGKRRRQSLLREVERRSGSESVLDLGWQDFEHLIRAWFERKGYAVSATPKGADGGVDLVLKRDGDTSLVQCKHWRAQRIGVDVVRQLYGVMTARGAANGFVVSVCEFTKAARDFADGRNVELIDARSTVAGGNVRASDDLARHSEESQVPECPSCGSAMAKRTAKRGANAGSSFYGCSQYPRCRGTRAIT